MKMPTQPGGKQPAKPATAVLGWSKGEPAPSKGSSH